MHQTVPADGSSLGGGSRFLAEERVISFIHFIEIEISQKFLCPSQNREKMSGFYPLADTPLRALMLRVNQRKVG